MISSELCGLRLGLGFQTLTRDDEWIEDKVR